ncbi:imidazolonepropionase-like amidohydrolase [Conyzicola nivalis]|uniref:Imidazolonepropionase-like amidohydrolase n=1 Tax=Conyzicola nivalis TaxID=1477021 RepID=A0ABV2QRF0_9MICO
MSAAVLVTADEAWVDGWTGPATFALTPHGLELRREASASDRAKAAAHVPGVLLPGFTDHHVHLGLVDPAPLAGNGIARVVDLGFTTAEAAAARENGADGRGVEVEFAGAMLTALGGYPIDRPWAPPGWSREVANEADAASAISEMRTAGASRIKIALNSVAGPVWSDGLLGGVVRLAHAAGLRVVAHAEGQGQVARAVRAGADALAHAPFTERLDDDDLRSMSETCAWISTLDIHGWGERTAAFEIALDNVARFSALGGRVLYGTDMGNGPLPVGINRRELDALSDAGLAPGAVISALTHTPLARETRVSWIPGAIPTDRADLARWLGTASVVAVDRLEETFA